MLLFSSDVCKIFKSTYFEEQLRAIASVINAVGTQKKIYNLAAKMVTSRDVFKAVSNICDGVFSKNS